MKKILIFFSLFLSSFLVFSQSSVADRPVAVIKLHKTEVLPQTKFRRYEKTMMLQKEGIELTLDEKKQLLDVLINQMLVRQDADQLGITVSEEDVLPAAMQGLSLELQQANRIPAGAVLNDPEQFRALLIDNGHDYELYLENTRNSMLIEKYVTQTRKSDFENMEAPSDEVLTDFYNSNIAQFAQPEYTLLSQIYFATNVEGADKTKLKNDADDLYKKISNGQADFDEMAKSAGSNFPYTQIKGQPFTIARADAQASQIFGESFTNGLFQDKVLSRIYLMESNIGFHIVRIDDRKDARIIGMDDKINPLQEVTVRDYLTQVISSQMQKQLYAQLQQQVVISLRERAEVNTFEDAL